MVRIDAAPTRVYEGESFRFQILLDNFDNPAQPDISYLESEFKVQYLGEQNRNSTQITIINNHQKRIEERGVTYNYLLTPKSHGRIQIVPPEIPNATIVSEPVNIEVIEPSEQENVFLEMSASTTSAYPMIPFDVTLSVFVKELPGKNAKHDPVKAISVELGPPALEIPWLFDEHLPDNLSAEKIWQDWITGYRSNYGGFEVNEIQTEDPFDIGFSFFEQRRPATAFLPKGKVVERTLKDGTTGRYWQYDFTRTFVGKTPGEVLFDAARIKGTFAVPVDHDEKLTTVDIYTISPSLTVQIREVPLQGRPDDYIGAFGTFDWTANLVPRKAHVGEALTLTLSLTGTGSTLNVTQPNLDAFPEISENFKIYPPTEEIGENSAKFTWSLRPLREGEITFPAIPISYFDAKKEQFVQVSTEPVPLTIEKSDVLELPSPATAVNKTPGGHGTLTRSDSGIYANRTDSRQARDERFTIVQWSRDLLILTALAVFAALVIYLARSARFARFCQRNDRLKEARRQYEQGLLLLKDSDAAAIAQAGNALKNAFLLPVCDWYNRPPETLTEADAIKLIQDINLPDTTLQKSEYLDFFHQLEQLRYGLDRPLLSRLRHEAGPIFERWYALVLRKQTRRTIKMTIQNIEKSRQTGHSGMNGSLLLLFCLGILTMAGGCSRVASDKDRAAFQEALRLFDEAQVLKSQNEESSQEAARVMFRKSAAVYEGLLAKGIVSGPILYNQGNAWWHAGEPAKALACWRKAQRFMPRDPYLSANLAMLGVDTHAGGERTHWENILFWQNWIASPTKFRLSLLSAALAAAAWLALAVLTGRKVNSLQGQESSGYRVRRVLLQLSILFSAFFLIMTTSALYDWNRFDRYDHGIVAVGETIARKGNSLSYEPAFAQPLPQLSEIVILGREGDWLRARAGDGQDCWLPASDVVVF
ncbi:MAG: BatD family protein [Planctomycetia bacterium]|nr:BatD family protein [Planctomycetia bacterium]